MSGFEIFLIANTTLVIVLLAWAVWLVLHEPNTERRIKRAIDPTYGPGYGLLQWREDGLDWNWELDE